MSKLLRGETPGLECLGLEIGGILKLDVSLLTSKCALANASQPIHLGSEHHGEMRARREHDYRVAKTDTATKRGSSNQIAVGAGKAELWRGEKVSGRRELLGRQSSTVG